MVSVIANQVEMRFADRVLYRFDKLCLSEQQTIHLQGDNGSGKTTLMKLFAGLLTPSKGQIKAEGFAADAWWRRNTLLGKAIYLHQHPYLFDGSVAYNLNYVRPLCHLSNQELDARTQQAIDMAQLGSLISQQSSSLSGGERQRLAIARAWIMRPKLLMLDEPTSNMDKYSQKLVLDMISDLKQQGTGMLISSHHHCSLTNLCDQIWQIYQQQIHTSSATSLSVVEKTQQELNYVTAS